MAERPKDLYDLLVSTEVMTQAQADLARAAAAKTPTSNKPAATPKPTSTKYPTIFSSTAATAFINKTFQELIKRNATTAELKYWKPLLKAAQEAGAASQKYAVKDKTGIQTTITGLDEVQWLKGQLVTNVAYKNILKDIDYAAEINVIKTTDPQYYARQEEKKVYDDAVLAAAGDAAKIAALKETTTYGRGLNELLAIVRASAESSGATNTPEELTAIAKKIYDKGISANSAQAVTEIENAFKSDTGLVKDQADVLTKLAADKKIYDRLIAAAGKDPVKIAAANDTTEYGRGLKEITAALQAKAKDNGAINTPEELTALAKKLYDKGVALGSQEGIAAVDAVLKTKNGLVADQPADLIKIAADKKIYDKLITAAAGDPTAIANAKTTTAYGRGLAEIEAALKAQANISGASNTAEEIAALAQEFYDTGIKPGSNQGVAKINSIFKFDADAKTGKYKGTAGTTFADLQKTATDNGLDLQQNFGGQISGWLTAIANGEDVKNIKQQIREVAKLGQPDSIKKLIDNGTDLKTIYAPYRNTMASILEIQDPNSIKLDDPTLRMAITPNGELNLYDYQKALRKDDRWQYTQQANSEVARATKQVLQDFGFMG
jgi:flagellar biosynthesis/type III secretory pathway protein FliH